MKNTDIVELAIWFHDVIYDPKRKDNEKLSAELFQEFAAAAQLVSRAVSCVALQCGVCVCVCARVLCVGTNTWLLPTARHDVEARV